jgi:GYF domain 2
MPIYINKNGQQSGPYEDHVVVDQLRNGMLSPNDMGIRHGEASWQRLGDMFPSAAASPSTPPVGAQAAGVVGNVASAAPETKKGGGCLKFGLLGVGLVLLVLGIGTAIGSRFIPSVSCDLWDEDEHKITKLRSDLEKANSSFQYDRVGDLTRQLNSAVASAETSQKYCYDDRFRNNVIGGVGGLMGFVGFLMFVVGLFVGRKK